VVTPTGVLDMGRLRGQEALHAARALGLPDDSVTFLGYPDAGTMPMWTSCWGSHAPHESLLTRVTAVPYQTALRPGAPYKPESIMQDLQTVLRTFRPTQVFVSHPDDAHPDHRAWYLLRWPRPGRRRIFRRRPCIRFSSITELATAGERLRHGSSIAPPPLAGAIAWGRRPLTAPMQMPSARRPRRTLRRSRTSRAYMLGFVKAQRACR
jgi:hypothetical protein